MKVQLCLLCSHLSRSLIKYYKLDHHDSKEEKSNYSLYYHVLDHLEAKGFSPAPQKYIRQNVFFPFLDEFDHSNKFFLHSSVGIYPLQGEGQRPGQVIRSSFPAILSANSHSKEAALTAGCDTQHWSPALRHGHQSHSCSSSNSNQSQTSQHRSNTASSDSSKSSSSNSIAGNSTDSQESEAT